jgi:hypothetical protein
MVISCKYRAVSLKHKKPAEALKQWVYNSSTALYEKSDIHFDTNIIVVIHHFSHQLLFITIWITGNKKLMVVTNAALVICKHILGIYIIGPLNRKRNNQTLL